MNQADYLLEYVLFYYSMPCYAASWWRRCLLFLMCLLRLAALVEFGELFDELRLLLGADQQAIGRIHDDEPLDPGGGDAPPGRAVDQRVARRRLQVLGAGRDRRLPLRLLPRLLLRRHVRRRFWRCGWRRSSRPPCLESDDDVARRVGGVERGDLAPTADVIPADRDGDDDDLVGAFHHPHINRDGLTQTWPGGAHDGLDRGGHASATGAGGDA